MEMNIFLCCPFTVMVMFVFVQVLCLFQLPSYCVSQRLFLFGDSLVDVGNNGHLFTLSKADFPPYGIDFLPSGGHPTGRFTNGRTISDIIGKALGAKSLPPPFLGAYSQGDVIRTGVNYAYGSAGILSETGSLFIGRIPLLDQVDYFEQTRVYMVDMMGENATMNILKNAIFSITIGSNDILNYIQPAIPFIGLDKVEPSIFQDFMISNLTMQLKRLNKLGGGKFLIAGVGPLGCIPFVRATKLMWSQKCSIEVNEFVKGYNNKLKEALTLLNQDTQLEATFVYANSFDIFMDIISNFSSYGFDNGLDPCCGGYFPPFICFQEKDTNTGSMLCKDRSKYVFWDAYHPTEAANLIMAQKLLDGDQTIASPLNVVELNLLQR